MIGKIIKTEIKSEVKIELDRINTRHKYKNTTFPMNVNYIHADGTSCKSAKRKANELPDLPPVEDSPQTTNTTGLAVETLSRTLVDMTSKDTVNDEVNNSNKPDQNTTDGLSIETEHQKDINKLPPLDETNSVAECEMDQNAGLTVEMTTDNMPAHPVQITIPIETNKLNEEVERVVETTVQASGDKTKENENTNSDELSMTKQLNNEPNESTSDNKKRLSRRYSQ